MTADDEIQELMTRIRVWHRTQLKQYRADLPEHEFEIARKACSDILKRAKEYQKQQSLLGVRSSYNQTQYFILPWAVVIWYSIHGKKTG